MNIYVQENKDDNGREAALKGASFINETLLEKGEASIIVATGASQFEMLNHLIKLEIDWSKIEIFHLDEYIGIPQSHPASFRKYLKERVADKLPTLKAFHYVEGDSKDITKEIDRLNQLISNTTIDVAFIGIGENGHIAFNDPPADFDTDNPYIVVTLDELCRKQQYGEGWFPSLEDVPKKAISMGIKQILKSRHIINTVPDERKSEAVANAVNGPVSNLCPASILQTHNSCYNYFDKAAASKL